VLEELFKGVETVCHIMEGRSETLTLTKLREGVFSLFKKVKLGEEHFAQFLTVLPGCFTVRWEGKSKKNLDLVVVRPEGVRGSREASFRKALQDIVLKFHEVLAISVAVYLLVVELIKSYLVLDVLAVTVPPNGGGQE